LSPLPDDPSAPRGDDDRSKAETAPVEASARYPTARSAAEYDFGAGVPPPFRLDSASVARIPLPAERVAQPIPHEFHQAAFPRDRVWLHAGLFLATLLTTTLMGMNHWAGYVSDFGRRPVAWTWSLLPHGLWYSVTILAILGSHELGHYFACRYHRINASLPYFIPVPPPFMTGTLGAVIRIRERFRSKRDLFDVGVAGPFAGFAVAVPALVLGIALSPVVAIPRTFVGENLGEPLIFKLVTFALKGSVPDGYSLNLHPVAFAAWFGLLATVLNLFPIGQLDGGHVAYAVFGRAARRITLAAVGTAIVLTFYSISWIVWTVMAIAMLYFFGLDHPPTIDDDLPLDRPRVGLAVAALLVFVLTFMAAPISFVNLLGK